MKYLVYLPDPGAAEAAEYRVLDSLMERFAETWSVDVDRLQALFKRYPGEKRYQKYRIHLEPEDSIERIQEIQRQIWQECKGQEWDMLNNCFFMYGENGRLMAVELYIKKVEEERKQAVLDKRKTALSLVSKLLAA